MPKKLILLITVFSITPLVFVLSLLFYLSVTYHAQAQNKTAFIPQHTVAFAALPSSENTLEGLIIEEDGRIESVRQFLKRYGSPLEPYAKHIVQMADQYNLDHRLIPAIAMQESNLCKKSRPESYNCWGFGIYGDKYHYFDSYEQAIETVTKTLANKYVAKGLETPDQIMKKYTPSSNGSWAFSVNYFMKEME